MSTIEKAVSPRLEVLRHALQGGDKNVLNAFWHEVVEQGTPLIESLEEDDDYSLVTFLWRAKETSSVGVISLLTGMTNNQMTRLLDTDLWYRTCRVRKDVRTTYQFSINHIPSHIRSGEDAGKVVVNWQPDPLNRNTFSFLTDEDDPTRPELVRSVLEMPGAPFQPWIESREGVPSGRVEPRQIKSEILGNERRLWVYTPAGYTPDNDKAYSLLILFDGGAYVKLVPTPTILDNLLSTSRIAPVVAVLADSLSLKARMRELLFHKPFNDFLVKELLPWIRVRYHVTSDPGRVVVGGSSAGGLAAAFAGLEHPECFGNILSQSGAFRWMPQGEEEYEWLARQFAEREKLPLRFYLDAGRLETKSLRDLGEGPSLLVANRHLRNVLRAKGYQVHYAEFAGGHDYICWRGTLSDGLQALFKEPPP